MNYESNSLLVKRSEGEEEKLKSKIVGEIDNEKRLKMIESQLIYRLFPRI